MSRETSPIRPSRMVSREFDLVQEFSELKGVVDVLKTRQTDLCLDIAAILERPLTPASTMASKNKVQFAGKSSE